MHGILFMENKIFFQERNWSYSLLIDSKWKFYEAASTKACIDILYTSYTCTICRMWHSKRHGVFFEKLRLESEEKYTEIGECITSTRKNTTTLPYHAYMIKM